MNVSQEQAGLLTTLFGPQIPEAMADGFGEVIMGVDIQDQPRDADIKAAVSVLVSNVVAKGLQAFPLGWATVSGADGSLAINIHGKRYAKPEAVAA